VVVIVDLHLAFLVATKLHLSHDATKSDESATNETVNAAKSDEYWHANSITSTATGCWSSTRNAKCKSTMTTTTHACFRTIITIATAVVVAAAVVVVMDLYCLNWPGSYYVVDSDLVVEFFVL
jgi:hypothetical protein